jgi:uncharacterized protein (DUF983 family)
MHITELLRKPFYLCLMFQQGQKMYSIFHMRCPRCHEGPIFHSNNVFKPTSALKMHSSCSVCGFNYQPEPGFYFGASYVSYALTTAIAIAVFVLLLPFFNWEEEWIYFSAIGGSLLLSFPIVFRLSRSIWINLFFKYKSPEERAKGEDADFPDLRKR